MNKDEKDALRRLRKSAVNGEVLSPTQLALYEDLRTLETRETGVASATGPEVGTRHTWVPDAEVSESAKLEWKLYKRVGKRMKHDPRVLDVKRKLENLLRNDEKTDPRPFAMISAPSGTGKTQLAFSLRAAGLKLIHLALVSYVGKTQKVYKNLEFNSLNLRMAVLEDFRRNRAFHEDVYAINCSRLRVNQTPLFTVEWLCRLLDIKGLGAFSVYHTKKHISKVRTEPLPVVFLDEIYYPDDKDWRLEHVRFLRNVLRSVGIVAVLMGTNCSVSNLVEKAASGSRSDDWSFWCRLIADLPKVSERTAEILGVTSAIARLSDPSWSHSHESLARLLETCKSTSNCLFVRLIAQEVNKLADEEFNRPTVELVDRVCSKVHSALEGRKPVFLKGQLCLQSNAYSDNTASKKVREGSTSLLVHHFASLTGGGRDVYLGPRGALNQLDSAGALQNFVLDAQFASASEDPLLYLVCCGGVRDDRTPRRPFYRYHFGTRIELSTLATMKRECVWNVNTSNANDPRLSGDELELLAMVSIGTASRLSGLRGTTLRNFLPLLCAELLPSYEPVTWKGTEYLDVVSTDLVGTKFADYLVPFIGVDSSPWSNEVVNLQGCNVANGRRAKNEEMVDLIVEYPPHSSTAATSSTTAPAPTRVGFAAECKNRSQNLDLPTLKGALVRIPKANALHFVFCRTTQGEYFTKGSWPKWAAQQINSLARTNVALVRCVEGRMRLVPLSLAKMPWVPWEACTKLVIVIAIDELSGQPAPTLDNKQERTHEESYASDDDEAETFSGGRQHGSSSSHAAAFVDQGSVSSHSSQHPRGKYKRQRRGSEVRQAKKAKTDPESAILPGRVAASSEDQRHIIASAEPATFADVGAQHLRW